MTTITYHAPVDRLLRLGTPDIPRTAGGWINYRKTHGISEADTPQLLEMVTDPALNEADPDSTEVWAPVHAWRALAQLGAEAAIPYLIRLVRENRDDDWFDSDMPHVFPMLGPAAVPDLIAILEDDSLDREVRLGPSEYLARMALQHPETREVIVAALVRLLERASDLDPLLNGFLIASLVDLKEQAALPIIQRAFEAGVVEEEVLDWEYVLIEFGLMSPSASPRTYRTREFIRHMDVQNELARNQARNQVAGERKEKAKRKAAKAARKKNRKR